MSRIFFSIALLLSSLCATRAQVVDAAAGGLQPVDTVRLSEKPSSAQIWKDCRFLLPPTALFASSAFARHHDETVRDWRNDHFPDYHTSLDNVLQVTPGVLTLGLRAFGVKGRSDNWIKLLSSVAFSTAISAATVEGLKNTVGRTRPDNQYERNSFPSGHTITSFTSATILHREYGGVSPWFSVGGYTLASFVGVSRLLNNRHWASDVLAGAGFGIVAGNLGYIITDEVFGGGENNDFSYSDDYQGSFGLSAVMSPSGADIPHITGELPFAFNRRYGYGYSIEGMYYPLSFLRVNHYDRLKIGVGVKTTLVYSFYDVDDDFLHSKASYVNESFSALTSNTNFRTQNYSFTPGVYLASPISNKWMLGCKALMGWGGAFSFNVDGVLIHPEGENARLTVLYDEYDYGWAYEYGLFAHYAAVKHLEVKAQVAYQKTTARYTFASHEKTPNPTAFLNVELGVSVPF
ncbi:MAG: phosphatase PAP2 family protein [Bacteroidales bacterium]|nr:phosphatase PAP2 family protein [Candidatus Physcocola equi]